ncbi:hypothetical protein FGIG_02353 [Fasciola gigantica]|uniref:Uncharacterized protein n=1 Tax=Fasciola gigantica TaxID=46835 RepID=A0A504YQQ0_FASGI|nr:hypothetical protein FGIG_02353 [Fasciola gigantica]
MYESRWRQKTWTVSVDHYQTNVTRRFFGFCGTKNRRRINKSSA